MGPAFGLCGPCQQPEHETEERQVPPGAPGSAPAVNQGWPRLVCGSNPNPNRLERLDVRVRGLALSFSAGLANSGAGPAWSRHLVSAERAGGPGTAKPEENWNFPSPLQNTWCHSEMAVAASGWKGHGGR